MILDCRHFNGYKPCGKSATCDDSCPHKDIVRTRLLIVHLGALGAVVRSTSLLKAMKRKFPASHLTWVTDAPAHKLLQGHPAIDRVLTTGEADLLSLGALEFDAAFVVDKSLKASGVLARTKADLVYGFRADARTGAVLPATPAAEELWNIGLSDHLKFNVNRKAETRLAHEALELGSYLHDDYWLPLTAREEAEKIRRRLEWSDGGRRRVIGVNTGCSDVIAAKKLSLAGHRDLIAALLKEKDVRIVLLGGPEDTRRNHEIAFGLDVISSATEAGLRDGLVSVAACDAVITGDSLGMHMAISQKVWTVAWFGPTCAHEIDLYGRGETVLSKAPCGPCWKRSCQQASMCYDQVDFNEILTAVRKGLTTCQKSQPLSAKS